MTKQADVTMPPGGTVPENLVRDLLKFAAWEPVESPRATAMREAAAVLAKLPTRQSDDSRLKDKVFAVSGFRIDTSNESKQMRIVFFHKPGNKQVLGYMELESPGAYDFATDVLKYYDQIEGIK